MLRETDDQAAWILAKVSPKQYHVLTCNILSSKCFGGTYCLDLRVHVCLQSHLSTDSKSLFRKTLLLSFPPIRSPFSDFRGICFTLQAIMHWGDWLGILILGHALKGYILDESYAGRNWM
jgi:hypothetical protein